MKTDKFKPIGYYPYRMALDIVDHIKPQIKDKVVCDIGCAWGDLLEYIRVRGLCMDGCGIELNLYLFEQQNYYKIS